MLVRLAWRSLWRHRRRTWITIASIAFGLTCAIFFVSLADGSYAQVVGDAVRMQAGHLTIENARYREAPAIELRIRHADEIRRRLAAFPEVERTKVLVLGQGVLRSGADAVGVTVMGVEPRTEAVTSPIARKIVAGSYLPDARRPGVVVGSVLAERLRVTPGKKVVLTTNDVNGQLVEVLFRVAGVFETGSEEIDGAIVQAALAPAQQLYGFDEDEVTRLGVLLHDPSRVPAVRERLSLSDQAEPLAVLSWREVLPELAAFIRFDRTSNLVFQAMLLLLILFTIVNTVLMSILEREHEHAVLLALGTPPGMLRRQVLCESFFVGLLGVASGLAAGCALAGVGSVWGLDISALAPEGMTISGFTVSPRVYPILNRTTLVDMPLVVLAVTMLATVVPLRRISRIPVADTIRSGAE